METLADELENDFAFSGSERSGSEEEHEPDQHQDQEDGVDSDDADRLDQDGVHGDLLDEHGNAIEAEEEKESRLHGAKKLRGSGQQMQGVGKFMNSMAPVLEVSNPIRMSANQIATFKAFRFKG